MKTNEHTCSCSNKQDHAHVSTVDPSSKKLLKRSVETIKMALPAFVFFIIPKCPVCLAGYIALGTGIGLSINTATYIRIGLIILCVVSMSYFIVKHVTRFIG